MNALTQLLGGIRAGHPASLMTGAGILIVVFLLAAGIAYIVYLLSPSGRVAAMLQERTARRTSSLAGGLLVICTLVFAFSVGNVYLDRDATCASCHKKSPEREALQKTAHKRVACSSCHAPTGAFGVIRKDLDYGRWVFRYASAQKVPRKLSTRLDKAACLRCHSAVESGTVTNGGIRVRHSDFLEEGAKCSDCHNDVAHPGVTARHTVPSMDKCLPCHDGTKASSECSTCHVKDVAQGPNPAAFGKIKVSGQWNSCYKCHDEKPCLRCHGVTMPHPPGWSDKAGGGRGTHARDGFKQREVCFRCHFEKGKPLVASAEGCKCHGLLGKMHGGKAWIREHGLQATGKKAGANAACFNCHTQELCDMCHPPSYRERYDPSAMGVDDYERDIPPDPLADDW